jgi:esterase
MILNSRIIGSSHKKIIILHGLLGSLDNWITFGKKISNKGFEVHLVDQRNHGKSFHSNEFSYEYMANDLKNYFNHFNIEKASIIGHSMGGKTAMLFALRNSDLLNKLIIVDILPISYKRDYKLIFDSLLNIDLNTIKSRNDFYLHLKKYFSEDSFILFLSKNLQRSSEGKFNFKSNVKILKREINNITSEINHDNFYQKEIIFVKGEYSDYVKESELKLSQKLFPKYKLMTISNAGHWLHHDNADDFFSVCLSNL